MSAVPGWQPTIVAPLPGDPPLPRLPLALPSRAPDPAVAVASGLMGLSIAAGIFLFGLSGVGIGGLAALPGGAPVWLVALSAVVALLWRWRLGLLRRATQRRLQAERLRVAEAALQATRARLGQHDQAVKGRSEAARVMRELHDSVGARLLSVLSLAQQVPIQAGALVPEGAPQQLHEMRRQVEASLLELRLTLDHLDRGEEVLLLRALADLRDHVEPLLAAAGIRLQWQCGAGVEAVALGSLTTLQLTRMAQESLLNIARHACAATQACVLLELLDGETGRHLRLAISDDGQPPGAAPAPTELAPALPPLRSGMGWARLQRQATELGAQLVTGAQSSGWLVDLVLPLPKAD